MSSMELTPTVPLEVAGASLPVGKGVIEPEALLTQEVRTALLEEARSVMTRISDPAMKREILDVGTKMRDISDRTGNLLKTRFKDIIADNPKRQDLDKGMEDMRDAIDNLNPERLGKLGLIVSLFTRNKLVAKLKKISQGYESAEKKIEVIDRALELGAKSLRADTDELFKLHDALGEQNREIAQRILVFKEILKGLEEKRQDPTFVQDRSFNHQVSTSVQDLGLMYLVNSQFMESIDVTTNNNTSLAESVHRVSRMASNMARAGLSLQSALLQQKRVVTVVNEVKDFMGNLLDSNAKLLQENAVEIAEAASSPLISLEKVQESYKILQQTQRDLEAVRQRTELQSRQALDTIDRVTAELKSIPALESPAGAAR